MDQTEIIPRRGSRRRWVVAIVIVILCIGVVLWWRLWQGGVGIGAASANLSRIEASDNTSSVASTSSSGREVFAPRRIWVCTDGVNGQHALLKRIAPLVRDAIQAQTHGEVLLQDRWDGDTLPDLTIRLRLDKVDETSGVYERRLQATVVASMGSMLVRSTHSYMDDGTPPVIDGAMEATVEHSSKSVGDGVGVDRYRLTGPHIAKALGDSLAKQLKDWSDKAIVSPAWFGKLTPAFEREDRLEFLQRHAARKILSGRGPMVHNRTLWQWTDTTDPGVVIDEIVNELQGAGWKLSTRGDAKSGDIYVRMTQGDRVVDAFREGRSFGAAGSEPAAFCVIYTHRVSGKERAAIIDGLMAGNDWREAGRVCKSGMSSEQRGAYVSRLEKDPGMDLADLADLAESAKAAGQTDKVRQAIVRAAVAVKLGGASGGGDYDRLRKVADELKLVEVLERLPSHEDLRAMGISEVPADGSATEVAGPPGTGLQATAKDGSGKMTMLFARVVLNAAGEPLLRRGWATDDGGSSSGTSWGSRGGGQWSAANEASFGDVSIKIDAEETSPGIFRVRMSLTRSPAAATREARLRSGV